MKTLGILLILAAFVADLAGQIGPITYNMVSYHGYTGAQHQTQYNLLQPNGYRLLSLSVAGGLSSARYSAVWIQQPGPTWAAVHGVTKAQYLAQATAWTNAGYRAKIVAASGVGGNVVFAAMWVQDGVTVGHFDGLSASQLTLDPSNAQITSIAETQAAAGRRLVSCASYNDLNIDRYVAVFEPDTTNIAWGVTAGDDLATFGYKFGEYTLGDARPSFVSVSDSQLYTTAYRDDRIGNWQMVVGRTAAQLTADKVTFDQQGLFPACIAAGGSGTNARYSAIFVERLTPIARTQTRTGQANSNLGEFDTYMEQLMADDMVRSASIAVARHGRLVFARGYTNAEPGYPTTQPTSLFRIGSISKPLCGAVAHDLIADGTGNLMLDTGLVNYLGIPNAHPDASYATVKRLLRHTSGIVGGVNEPDVAVWWANNGGGGLVVLPCNERVLTRYACTLPSSSTQGHFAYSNIGNTAVGEMVEQATGLDYLTALQARLFTPVGGNVPLFEQQARPQNLAPGEVRYHLPQLYLRWQNLHADRRLLTAQYSADYWDSAGGVVTSAVALARVLSGAFCIGDDSPSLSIAARTTSVAKGQYQIYNQAGQANLTDSGWFWTDLGSGRFMYQHNGAADGCATRALWTSDGLCIVAVTNMSGATPNHDTLLAKADAVTNWPTYDLFPSFGLASFSRTPLLQSVNAATKPNVSESAFQFTGEGLEQVVDVRFGNTTITSQSPSDWHSGYFVKVSPTRLDVHPPQGLSPGQYGVLARSWNGLGNTFAVQLSISTNFLTKAADAVPMSQPFSVLVSQGQALSDVTVVFLCVSLDLLPSVYPGAVNLDIGNGFANLLISDGQWVNNQTHTARWDFPPIGSAPHLHLQAVGLDLLVPDPWPLPASNVETVLRN